MQSINVKQSLYSKILNQSYVNTTVSLKEPFVIYPNQTEHKKEGVAKVKGLKGEHFCRLDFNNIRYEVSC